MKLYQEILFLDNIGFKVSYVVENVIPYYEPLIPAKSEVDIYIGLTLIYQTI
jgi:hypothetical protein